FRNPKFELITHDIINPISLRVDEIYNFACPASPPHYQYDPIFTMKTSVIGMLNMLELARFNKAKIMQASTSEIYGDPLEHPQKESYRGNVNPIGPRACYDEGKRAAETLCFDYWRKYETKIKVIRIFNTYGPRMREDDGRVVSNFIVQAIKGEDITVYGDGNQTRSFCYVSDLIDGIVAMMNSEDELRGPINLGNPSEFKVIELAEMVIKLTNSKSKIVFKPLPEDDPKIRKPDITVAKEKLNWEPKVPLEEGLKETIKYFREYLGINKKLGFF
ncbi:MAG: UDP-glucuronic acid decarboxylase family protein, partial [Brevinematia bacterium]